MPRQTGIKWTNAQTKELRRQVKRFNAKIGRTVKKNPAMADFLPPKLSVRDLRQSIKTTRDLRLFSASVDRAFVDGAFNPIITEQGVRTTNYQVRELSLGVQRINRARTKELKRGAPSTEKGTMGTIQSNNLLPKKFNINRIQPGDWDAFVKSVEKQSMSSYTIEKMIKYKENYLMAIRQNLGYSQEANALYDYVANLSPQFMYDNFYNDPITQIQFISDPLPALDIATSALEHWMEATGDNGIYG